jgi:hypothetical protein
LDICRPIGFCLFRKTGPYFLPEYPEGKRKTDESGDDELNDVAPRSQVDVAVAADREQKENKNKANRGSEHGFHAFFLATFNSTNPLDCQSDRVDRVPVVRGRLGQASAPPYNEYGTQRNMFLRVMRRPRKKKNGPRFPA